MEDAVFHMRVIAKLHGDLTQKFGIPRQSGLAESVRSRIIFEPEFRIREALRGLEDYSHIWLLWAFSKNIRGGFSPTVRPPRLGGNIRMGVFATRSPFRPNPIGLSCVELLEIEHHPKLGDILHVGGADLMDGTPILDIKPYIAYADAHPDALSGFAAEEPKRLLVRIPQTLLKVFPKDKQKALVSVLELDPRPAYKHDDPDHIYAFEFAGITVRFVVHDATVTVVDASVTNGD